MILRALCRALLDAQGVEPEPWSVRPPIAPRSSDPPTSPRSSPCPGIEARSAALSAAGPVEVEPDSGPVTLRPGLALELACYCGAVEASADRDALLPPLWAPLRRT